MKVLSCMKLVFPGDRAPASAQVVDLGSGSLDQRPRVSTQVQLPWNRMDLQ